MAAYFVRTRKDQLGAKWQRQGMWIIGSREDSHLIQLTMASADQGLTFRGTLTYSDGYRMEMKAKSKYGNVYHIEMRAEGESAWSLEGSWVIGGEVCKPLLLVDLVATPLEPELQGNLTFVGERPQEVQSTLAGVMALTNA